MFTWLWQLRSTNSTQFYIVIVFRLILSVQFTRSETSKLDFIVNAYTAENEEEYFKSFDDRTDTNGNDKKDEAGTSSSACQGDSGKAHVTGMAHATAPIDKDVQLVLDMLPDLEVGFIQKLLSRYDNVETAIAAYLEGNIPPDLDETVAQDLAAETPPATNDDESIIDALVASNLNDGVRITGGHMKTKSVKRKTEKRILDDRADIKDFHERHYEYGYISEDDVFDNPNQYDDEYDDSYDAMVESETKSFAKIIRGQRVVNDLVDEVESESGDDDRPGQSAEQRDKTRDFCENPETIRARWAQHREAKFASKRPQKAPSKPAR